MPRIRCLYVDCNFLDAGYCSAPSVEFDPDLGCATYIPLGDEDVLSDDWDEDSSDYDDWETEVLDLDDDDFAEEEEDEDDW